jgi:polygalacturonase
MLLTRLPSLFVLTLLFAVSGKAADFSVNKYGAKGDGQAIDTTAIQKAIDDAAHSKGTVIFRPGVYMSGALFLKSGVTFRVDEGVTIRGVQELSAYPEMLTRIAGIEMTWPSALLNVYKQANVKITGKGTVDGQGKYWWDRYWSLRKEYEPKGLRWASDYDAKRIRLIQVYQSSNVNLDSLTLQRSGFWTVQLCYSKHVTVDGITIQNNIDGRGPSTDGIDVDSSSDITIMRCDISCNDDAICMKAGRDADGLRVNRPTENVVVRDCIIRQGAAGITIGSETSGGIRHVDVSGLRVLAPVPKGICFKSAKVRGGMVQDIKIMNLDLDGVAVPVSISLNWNPSYSYAHIPEGMKDVPEYWRKLAQPVSPEQGMPHFQNVQISDIKARGAKRAFEVSGFASDPIRNFHFSHLDIQAVSAGIIADADNWTFEDTNIQAADGKEIVTNDSQNIKGLSK